MGFKTHISQLGTPHFGIANSDGNFTNTDTQGSKTHKTDPKDWPSEILYTLDVPNSMIKIKRSISSQCWRSNHICPHYIRIISQNTSIIVAMYCIYLGPSTTHWKNATQNSSTFTNVYGYFEGLGIFITHHSRCVNYSVCLPIISS
jgi:hypothetical protein